jgi:putative CocE/NonD family hydrolase
MILALLALVAYAPPQPGEARVKPDALAKRSVMIPMRDGVRLHTVIYRPRNHKGALPFLIERTPYGINPKGEERIAAMLPDFVEEGFIFVQQDIRGKFKSEGEFVMIRPPREDRAKGIDESTDCYDTVEWLLKNVEDNNGKAGMWGVSYLGWTTIMAALDPHPALAAVSPMASPDDMYLGDDFHHNGAFRLQYGFEYVGSLESGKENKPFVFDKHDLYDWYLGVGSLTQISKRIFQNRYPTWNDFVEHPNFDAFWKKRKVSPYLTRTPIPTLNVAGWWDQEDFYGPLKIYEALEKHDTNKQNYLVVGPWNHGGWMSGDGDKLGPIDFGSKTGPFFRKDVMLPWFRYWLKGKQGKLDLPEALTYRAGANAWQRHSKWPPVEAKPTALYFAPNGKLDFDAPTKDQAAFDEYVSDPNKPVPYRVRPILPVYGKGSSWSQWLTDDQRHVHNRPDVLSWQTDVLTSEVVISGEIKANLFASTTGSDADWVVKLIDVYPDRDETLGGYQFMVANDVLRGRFRNGFETPEPITPNQVTSFPVDLHTQDYEFGKGHRIMVQVQSTWFPLIDRNPQKFVPNIFLAQENDFQAATHRVYRTAKQPSNISIPVMRK